MPMTKEQAERKAQFMLDALPNPEGWEPLVWENTGWHANLNYHDVLSLWLYDTEWHAMIGPEGSGLGIWHQSEHHPTAMAAIKAAVEAAQAKLHKFQEFVNPAARYLEVYGATTT